MPRLRDTFMTLLRGLYNATTIILTVIGVIILAAAGFFGPQADTAFGRFVQAVSPYRWYLALLCFAVAWFSAIHKGLVEAERHFYATNSHGREDRVKSELASLILRGEKLANGNDGESIAKWDEDTRRVLSLYLIPSAATRYSALREVNSLDVAIGVLKTYFQGIEESHITWRGYPDHP